MRNFSGGGNRGGGFSGGRSGGGRGGFGGRSGGRDGDRPSMHRAMCSECGNSCEVPFRPTGEKPVYCNDCFGSKKAKEDRGDRGDFGSRPPRREFNDRPRPSFDKPANDDSKKLLMEVISKLDRLTGIMENFGQPKKDVKPAVVAETETKVETKKKAPAKEVKKDVEVKAVVKKVATKKVVAKKAKK